MGMLRGLLAPASKSAQRQRVLPSRMMTKPPGCHRKQQRQDQDRAHSTHLHNASLTLFSLPHKMLVSFMPIPSHLIAYKDLASMGFAIKPAPTTAPTSTLTPSDPPGPAADASNNNSPNYYDEVGADRTEVELDASSNFQQDGPGLLSKASPGQHCGESEYSSASIVEARMPLEAPENAACTGEPKQSEGSNDVPPITQLAKRPRTRTSSLSSLDSEPEKAPFDNGKGKGRENRASAFVYPSRLHCAASATGGSVGPGQNNTPGAPGGFNVPSDIRPGHTSRKRLRK